MRKHALLLALIVLLVAVVACGEIPTQEPLPGGPTQTPSMAKSKGADWPAEAQPMVEQAIADAAKQAQVAPTDVKVIQVESVEWRDSCLGCAEKGTMCMDVITPGYRIVLQVGDQEYVYHTDMQGNVLYCPAGAPGEDWGEAQPMVDEVVADLAGRLGMAADKISVVRVEKMMWPDSSLGCPQPGQSYLQVITEGYQITLEAQGQQYDYHTGMDEFVLCQGATD